MADKAKINPSRVWLEREIAAFAAQMLPGSMVLDAGAGDQRYSGHFSHCTYESADFEAVDKAYGASTYRCDLRAIPVEPNRYDAVLFTQVMEHLPEPDKVIAELMRVLKPGGRMLYTGPLFYEEHEVPHDYYRYTQFAVRMLFQRAGLEIVELRWLAGYFATVNYQLKRMIRHLPRDRGSYGAGWRGLAFFLAARIFRPLARFMADQAAEADIRDRLTQTGFPLNYLAVLRKPPEQSRDMSGASISSVRSSAP